MASLIQEPAVGGEHRFFRTTAWMLAILVPGGFVMNLAAGRTSLDVPLVFHLHAFFFFGFVVLYTVQANLAAGGNIALHKRLGQLAAFWIPAMLVMGVWLTLATLQFRGGPPFFAQAEFLVVNFFHLASFGALAFAAINLRRHPDWHKRLMFGAMVTVGSPGIARLLPLPYLIPYVFPALFAVVSIFPIAGMIMDRRVHGRVHPAWWWALLAPLAALALGEAVYATGIADQWVANWVAGTSGAERPAGPFLPPGM